MSEKIPKNAREYINKESNKLKISKERVIAQIKGGKFNPTAMNVGVAGSLYNIQIAGLRAEYTLLNIDEDNKKAQNDIQKIVTNSQKTLEKADSLSKIAAGATLTALGLTVIQLLITFKVL